MSCGNEVEGRDGEKTESLMPKKRVVKRVDKKTCQKCKELKSMFIIRSMTFCTGCFEFQVMSRFTKQLYPPLHPWGDLPKAHNARNLYRPKRQSGTVLIGMSGGAGSMAMLDRLHRGGYIGKQGEDTKFADKTKGEKDVVWEDGVVVHVDYSSVVEGETGRALDMATGESAADLRDRRDWIRSLAEERGLGFLGLKAEDVFDPTLSSRLSGRGGQSDIAGFKVDLSDSGLPILPQASSSKTPLESLQSLLASVPHPSRPALMSHILNALLNAASTYLPNISHVLIGETSTRQAERIISATASGRGWSLPLELATTLELDNGVKRISPMKDLSYKEAAFSCRIRRLETRNYRGWDRTKVGAGSDKREARGKGGAMSIEGLTEQFITVLSATHPATVSTIGKTGDKLVFPGGQTDQKKLCPLCQMPVDPSALEWKSRTGLTALPGKLNPPTALDSGRQTDSSRAQSQSTHSSQLAPLLCYSCLATLTPSSHAKKDQLALNDVELPIWVGRRVAVERDQMRSQVAEFLLED